MLNLVAMDLWHLLAKLNPWPLERSWICCHRQLERRMMVENSPKQMVGSCFEEQHSSVTVPTREVLR